MLLPGSNHDYKCRSHWTPEWNYFALWPLTSVILLVWKPSVDLERSIQVKYIVRCCEGCII